jgi:peroxiredoxin Q/BCP
VLPSNSGKEISLKDLAGKRTVLYFYPGDFTQGCTIEAQAFERDIEKYKDLGVQVVGVSVDSVDKHLDFKKKYGLDFPLLSDQGGKVSDKYGSLLDLKFLGKFSNRQTYIISPEGKIEYVFTDVESKVAKHSEDVLKKLSNL